MVRLNGGTGSATRLQGKRNRGKQPNERASFEIALADSKITLIGGHPRAKTAEITRLEAPGN